MTNGENEIPKQVTELRRSYQRIFNFYGINELSDTIPPQDFDEIARVTSRFDDLIEEAEAKNFQTNFSTLITYLGATREQIISPNSSKTPEEEDAFYKNSVENILRYINNFYGSSINPELTSEFDYGKQIISQIKDKSFSSRELLTLPPSMYSQVIRELERVKEESDLKDANNWTTGIRIKLSAKK